MASVRGDEKMLFLDFWPAGDFGGPEVGRAGSVGVVEDRRHFCRDFEPSDLNPSCFTT